MAWPRGMCVAPISDDFYWFLTVSKVAKIFGFLIMTFEMAYTTCLALTTCLDTLSCVVFLEYSMSGSVRQCDLIINYGYTESCDQ